MAKILDDQAQARLGLAALFVAFAKTLDEQDKSFSLRFSLNLEKVYRSLEDQMGAGMAGETLIFARELLHGLSE